MEYVMTVRLPKEDLKIIEEISLKERQVNNGKGAWENILCHKGIQRE